jgi:hypothetical protein
MHGSAEARGNLLLSAEHTSYSCDIGDDGIHAILDRRAMRRLW